MKLALRFSEREDLQGKIPGYLTRHTNDVLMETHVVYWGNRRKSGAQGTFIEVGKQKQLLGNYRKNYTKEGRKLLG